MSVVAGIDFGTLSVRASIFDSQRGRLGSGIAPYPPHRKREDPDYATQSHSDHMRALLEAVMLAIASAGIDGRTVAAIAPDTTGSSVVPVGEKLEPLDDYYLWCDHRAWREAELITRTAEEMDVEAIRWCGGRYSSEWGFSKLLHWLRNHPEKREKLVTALGSAIFAFLAAGAFKTILEAQVNLCPQYQTFEPQQSSRTAYEELFDNYQRLYFAFGEKTSVPVAVGEVLPSLRRTAVCRS